MIPSLDESRRSLAGAWLLLRNDPRGFAAMDTSYDGFLRSFSVVLFLLPFYFINLNANMALRAEDIGLDTTSTSPTGSDYLFEVVLIGLDWITFPLLAMIFVRQFGGASHYSRLIVARNWASLIAIQFIMIPTVLFLVGLIDSSMLAFLRLVSLAIILRYQYTIIRNALGCAISPAIGLVTLDVLVTIFVTLSLQSLTGN